MGRNPSKLATLDLILQLCLRVLDVCILKASFASFMLSKRYFKTKFLIRFDMDDIVGFLFEFVELSVVWLKCTSKLCQS